MILRNNHAKAKWFHYEINGVKKKVLIQGHTELEIPEIRYTDEINFSSIDESVQKAIDNGKNFKNGAEKSYDSAVVVPVPAAKPNLIVDGDFSSGNMNIAWTLGAANTQTETGGGAAGGNYGRIWANTKVGAEGYYKGQTITGTEAGKTYRLSGYVKETGSGGEVDIIAVQNGTFVVNKYWANVPTWTYFNDSTFVSDGNDITIQLFYYYSTTPGNSADFSDLKLIEV